MAEAVKELCDIERSLREIAERNDAGHLAPQLLALAEKLKVLCVPAAISIEALNPIFEIEGGSRGYLDVLTMCYNAFMHGRNGLPQDREAARCDWFNDTRPMMEAGVEKLKTECMRRVEYAREQDERAARRRSPAA